MSIFTFFEIYFEFDFLNYECVFKNKKLKNKIPPPSKNIEKNHNCGKIVVSLFQHMILYIIA